MSKGEIVVANKCRDDVVQSKDDDAGDGGQKGKGLTSGSYKGVNIVATSSHGTRVS